MGLNTGYLKAVRTEESNEQYTPFYAVDPITKYIPKTKKIWCPFDCEWSAYFQKRDPASDIRQADRVP